MKKKILSLVTMLVAVLLVSCGNLTTDEINEKCASGVVLIRNQSYFELRLNNGESFYFTDFNTEEDTFEGWTSERSEIEKNESYGTGFFISDKGLIATNHHVVASKIDDDEAKRSLSEMFNNYKEACYGEYYSYDEEIEGLEDTKREKFNAGEDYSKEDSMLAEIHQERAEIEARYRELERINVHKSKLIYHREIGISYNNSWVKKESDVIPCTVLKTDPQHDLAIIQLDSKVTPSENYIFNVPAVDPLNSYTFKDNMKKKAGEDKNSNVYMISFNLGPQLALTTEGIKSQINLGNISQKTDEQLLYSIPSLPGSSGSPVVNEQGELVAVNFAGLNGTQGFNYGIRVKFLYSLLQSLPK